MKKLIVTSSTFVLWIIILTSIVAPLSAQTSSVNTRTNVREIEQFLPSNMSTEFIEARLYTRSSDDVIFTINIPRVAIRYTMGTLLGEPVYSVALQWEGREHFRIPGVPYFDISGFESGPAWSELERYPSIVRALKEIRPLDVRLTVQLNNESEGSGVGQIAELVVDLPDYMNEWGVSLVSTSPEWENWHPRATSPSSHAESLKDLFRAVPLKGPVVITKIMFADFRFPAESIALQYSMYLQLEADRIAALNASSNDFWGSSSPSINTPRTDATSTLSNTRTAQQSQTPQDTARSAEIQAMRQRAQRLASGGNAAEFSMSANGETLVTANSVLTSATAIIGQGQNQRRVQLAPGRGVNLGRLPPGTEIRIESNGFELASHLVRLNTGILSGIVVSATTGQPIPNVQVSVQGQSDVSVFTNSQGSFSFNVPIGNIVLVFSHTDYVFSNFTIQVGAGQTIQIPNSSIVGSPILLTGQFRIILTWGVTPSDLDAYLSTPIGNIVSFINRNPSNAGANLDVDKQGGFGPETITITNPYSGSYKFYVHQYSSNGSLTSSNAIVRVYSSQGLVETFYIPTFGSGRYWYVFNIVNGIIEPVNQILSFSP